MNLQIRLIYEDPDMSAAEKREKIDGILRDQNNLFEQMMRQVPEEILRARGLSIPPKQTFTFEEATQ